MSRYCEKCGTQLPDYAGFCDKCGTPLPAINQSTSVQTGYTAQNAQQMYGQQQYHTPPQHDQSSQQYGQMPQQYNQAPQQYEQTPHQYYQVPDAQLGKKSSPIVPVILVVLCLAVLGAGGFYGYKYFLGGQKETAAEIADAPDVEQEAENDEAEKNEDFNKADEEEVEIEEKEIQTVEYADETDENKDDESSSADKYELTEGLKESDFYWVAADEAYSAIAVSSYEEILGRWKVMISFYDAGDYIGCEYGYGEFSGDFQNAKWTFYPMELQYNGEPPIDESNDELREYEGWFKDDDVYFASILGNIKGNLISTGDKSQYFIGTLTLPDGMESSIYMIRP